MLSLNPDLYAGQAVLLDELRAEIEGSPRQGEGLAELTAQDLLDGKVHDWEGVRAVFLNNFRLFEQLLFRLHFKRKAVLSEASRSDVLKFLAIGYFYARDVRYFNEFLHFKGEGSRYWLLMVQMFFGNLDQNSYHSFPLCSRGEMDAFLQEASKALEPYESVEPDTSLRVGLLGSPTFFKQVRAQLKAKGFKVNCYFIPFHPDKKINFLLKNPLTFLLLRLLKGGMFKFKRLNADYKSPEIRDALTSESLDIGFHKLGFIIKNNIISPFKTGLINDHWAILPFIRGLSTIQYSLLLGAPIAATAHFVEETVDSGGIIKIYRYDNLAQKYSTVAGVRNHIRAERDFRAIDSVVTLAKTRKAMIENPADQGLMFYSIHPVLEAFIESHLLKASSC